MRISEDISLRLKVGSYETGVRLEEGLPVVRTEEEEGRRRREATTTVVVMWLPRPPFISTPSFGAPKEPNGSVTRNEQGGK